jgi:hypothetical protein
MQTPPTPKSPAEVQPPEDIKAKHRSLKRSLSMAFSNPPERPEHPEHPEQASDPVDQIASTVDQLASDLAFHFVQRIMSVLKSKRMSPAALIALCDDLEAMPHVQIPTPTNARERAIKHRVMMDNLLEAAQNAHAEARNAWNDSPWQKQSSKNFCVIDGETEDHKGNAILDGCGICGVPKTECMKQDEHFGPRGESPPDSVCPHCKENFYNRYNASYRLQLHIARKHADKKE